MTSSLVQFAQRSSSAPPADENESEQQRIREPRGTRAHISTFSVWNCSRAWAMWERLTGRKRRKGRILTTYTVPVRQFAG